MLALSEALESVGIDKHFSNLIVLYKSPGDSDAVGLGRPEILPF